MSQQHRNIHEWFDQSVDRFENRIAVTSADTRLTYRELAERSNRIANFLLANEAPRGGFVGILLQDSLWGIPALIGTLKAGCAFVPIDATFPATRMKTIMRQVPLYCVITESGTLPILDLICDVPGQYFSVDAPAVSSFPGSSFVPMSDFFTFTGTATPHLESMPEDMCSIYFTSGSLGQPKAIAGQLKGIDHFIEWEVAALGVGEGVRVSHLLPLFFDGSLRDIFLPLCAGGAICVPPDKQRIVDPQHLVSWLEREQVEVMHCVPSLFRSLLNEPDLATALRSLRYIVMAGEPLLPADFRKWREIYSGQCQLVNLYGQTETTMAKFAHFVCPEDLERRTIPIGKPITGCTAMLLDEAFQPCPSGAVGEMFVRTPYRSLGYFGQPDLTKRVFIQNPFRDDPGDIIYRTGDLARLSEDGLYEFMGRRDRQVKVRGIRIELNEIEQALQEHPSVKEVAVIDRKDGQGYAFLCAYVVTVDGTDDVSFLPAFAEESLPKSHIPAAYVVLKHLPRTLTGKLDRRLLATTNPSTTNYEPPVTEIEKTLTEIWQELLSVPRVGLKDSFFRLGGHSLLATQLLSRIRARFDVEIPLRQLFVAPTLEQQAGLISESVPSKNDDRRLAWNAVDA